jgi:hypothetical protein
MRKAPIPWPEITILAILAILFVVGLAANDRTLTQSLLAVGFLGALLFLAWLHQITVRATPLTAKQRLWTGAVLVALLLALALLAWQGFTGVPGPQAAEDTHAPDTTE